MRLQLSSNSISLAYYISSSTFPIKLFHSFGINHSYCEQLRHIEYCDSILSFKNVFVCILKTVTEREDRKSFHCHFIPQMTQLTAEPVGSQEFPPGFSLGVGTQTPGPFSSLFHAVSRKMGWKGIHQGSNHHLCRFLMSHKET